MTCPNPLDSDGLPKSIFVDDVSVCPFCGFSDLSIDSDDIFRATFNCNKCNGFFEWSREGDLAANQNFLTGLQ